ncbi:heat shock protein DnaJ domain protein [Planctopirus limnophila DSM 3776]|uniref:Heat shock protein DnaJ domain protein n=1 Tax=Planctopirus limnophila (strain ATCC 43296 / DSM 3776 / IFAM 1008 / Mu 290) TaxID=521674 RepID=D5STG1_PLAL2|nr:J domain-containing protein [Planctopirus limnophila]ADG68990.1 heat shock protein DnaJ domain protein [Planctopirus limnophila DSM 3776]
MNLDEACQILGVTKGCKLDSVKKRHRLLVQVWHPDRFSENSSTRKAAEAELKEVNAAIELIERTRPEEWNSESSSANQSGRREAQKAAVWADAQREVKAAEVEAEKQKAAAWAEREKQRQKEWLNESRKAALYTKVRCRWLTPLFGRFAIASASILAFTIVVWLSLHEYRKLLQLEIDREIKAGIITESRLQAALAIEKVSESALRKEELSTARMRELMIQDEIELSSIVNDIRRSLLEADLGDANQLERNAITIKQNWQERYSLSIRKSLILQLAKASPATRVLEAENSRKSVVERRKEVRESLKLAAANEYRILKDEIDNSDASLEEKSVRSIYLDHIYSAAIIGIDRLSLVQLEEVKSEMASGS